MIIKKTKKVKSCPICGGKKLKCIDFDPESFDETDDEEYSNGYECLSCLSITSTDGKITTSLISTGVPFEVMKFSDKRELAWVK